MQLQFGNRDFLMIRQRLKLKMLPGYRWWLVITTFASGLSFVRSIGLFVQQKPEVVNYNQNGLDRRSISELPGKLTHCCELYPGDCRTTVTAQ